LHPLPDLPIIPIPQIDAVLPKNPDTPHAQKNANLNIEIDIGKRKQASFAKVSPGATEDLIIVIITGLTTGSPWVKNTAMDIIGSTVSF
jgi:hypothetical protein